MNSDIIMKTTIKFNYTVNSSELYGLFQIKPLTSGGIGAITIKRIDSNTSASVYISMLIITLEFFTLIPI